MFTYAATTPADTGRRLRWVSGGELALGVSTDITNTDADYIGRETKCRLGRRYTNMRAMHRALCLCSYYAYYCSDRCELKSRTRVWDPPLAPNQLILELATLLFQVR